MGICGPVFTAFDALFPSAHIVHIKHRVEVSHLTLLDEDTEIEYSKDGSVTIRPRSPIWERLSQTP